MRAAFTPTQEQRATARALALSGMRQIDIAARLGVSRPTLLKYFSDDIRRVSDSPTTDTLFDSAAPSRPPAPQSEPVVADASSRRGRPRYVPSRADRARVDLLVAAGWTPGQIARTLGVTEPTVRRAYADEIETGALRKRAENLARIDSAARKGNVTAMRTLAELFDGVELARLAPAAPSSEPRRPREEPIGKKVADQQAAIETLATSAWSAVLTPDPGRAN